MIINSTNGTPFKIDRSDLPLVSKHLWMIKKGSGTLYVYTKISGKVIWLHRFLLKPGPNQIIDHKNHDGTDNRRSNIRICDWTQNSENTRFVISKSGYKGVFLKKHESGNSSWVAQVKHRGKVYYRGGFKTAREAAIERDAIALKHHAEFAKLNFPKDPKVKMKRKLSFFKDALGEAISIIKKIGPCPDCPNKKENEIPGFECICNYFDAHKFLTEKIMDDPELMKLFKGEK